MQQENSTVEKGADPRKYQVGAMLRFVEIASGELSVEFEPGDLLVVEPKNGCGMGIDARRCLDDKVDMVWPEEVDFVASGDEVELFV